MYVDGKEIIPQSGSRGSGKVAAMTRQPVARRFTLIPHPRSAAALCTEPGRFQKCLRDKATTGGKERETEPHALTRPGRPRRDLGVWTGERVRRQVTRRMSIKAENPQRGGWAGGYTGQKQLLHDQCS